MMDMNEIIALLIVAAAVILLVRFLKQAVGLPKLRKTCLPADKNEENSIFILCGLFLPGFYARRTVP